MEYEDYAAYEQAAEQISTEQKKLDARKWRNDPRWKSIQGITREELKTGSARIEKLDRPPWEKKGGAGLPDKNQTGGNVIGYGKYADKTYEWVKQTDPKYFLWCSENIPKFGAKVKQLGLD